MGNVFKMFDPKITYIASIVVFEGEYWRSHTVLL